MSYLSDLQALALWRRRLRNTREPLSPTDMALLAQVLICYEDWLVWIRTNEGKMIPPLTEIKHGS